MYQLPVFPTLLIVLLLLALLDSGLARPRPGIEEHIAEAAEETFQVLDPPRIRDSSEQFHQAVESHQTASNLTAAERQRVLASQGVLAYHRKAMSTVDIRQNWQD